LPTRQSAIRQSSRLRYDHAALAMNRRHFLQLAALSGASVSAAGPALAASPARPAASSSPVSVKPFEWQEATIDDLQTAMKSSGETAVSLAKKYLRRIDEMDQRGPTLRAVLEINPDALDIARALDKERKEKGPRGPLHGIPVLIKDNIDTHDRMKTSAGSFALLDAQPQKDSFVAQKLREAGAVILGKTNLSEWANFRGERSSSGWSARGGQTNNPFALDRNPSGSSSGSAASVSASFCAVAVGTETDGSIISPAALCGVVGIKPTVGLISRSGIIPISKSQDTAGPMARTVTDAAEPELEPEGFRSSAKGLFVWPPRPLQPLVEWLERKLAHSLRLVLPRITAPASRNFCATKASRGAMEP